MLLNSPMLKQSKSSKSKRSISLLSLLALSAATIVNCSAQTQSNSQVADRQVATVQTASAEASTSAPATQAASPLIVAELFTSQSCSSCPPAEDLFAELSEIDNMLTLEWHVDYWDDLVHGGSRWKDRYSNADYTERQRAYNRTIRGKSGVYTPQAVVNGRLEGVGSRPLEVAKLVQNAPDLTLPVSISNNRVTVGAADAELDVLFVRLLKSHKTDVKGGENKGRLLHGKNIVLEAKALGRTGASSAQFTLPSVGSNETCAVIVQDLAYKLAPVVGAAKCGT